MSDPENDASSSTPDTPDIPHTADLRTLRGTLKALGLLQKAREFVLKRQVRPYNAILHDDKRRIIPLHLRFRWWMRQTGRRIRPLLDIAFGATVILAVVGIVALIVIAPSIITSIKSVNQLRMIDSRFPPKGGEDRLKMGDSAKDTAFADSFLASPKLDAAETIIRRDVRFRFGIRMAVGSCPTDKGTEWEPTTRTMLVCAAQFTGIFKNDSKGQERRIRAAIFAVMHEFGHAIVSDRGLAVLGREEDAADAFATIVTLKAGLSNATLDGAAFLDGLGAVPMDVHSPGTARGQFVRCMVYGSDNRKFDYLADQEGLNDNGRGQCIRLWNEEVCSWSYLADIPSFRALLNSGSPGHQRVPACPEDNRHPT